MINRNIIQFFGIIVLLLANACTTDRGKWAWVRDALDRSQHLGQLASPDLQPSPRVSHPFFNPIFQRQIDRLSSSYLTSDNKIELLADRDSTLKKLSLIRSAKSTVFLTSFMLMCDESGEEFLDALAKAADRGVDVRVLLDGGFFTGIYAGWCPESFQSKKGIQVSRSVYSLLGSGEDMRLHDKLFIVDGDFAITGGQNIGSFWADASGLDGYFRDTDVLVEGPVVTHIAQRFVRIWKTVHPTNHNLAKYESQLSEKAKAFLAQGSLGIKNYDRWLSEKEPKGLCRFVGQDPQLGTHNVFKVYTALTQAAQKHIVFHVPSLNGRGSPEQETLLGALVDVSKNRRVRVDVITNGPGFLHSPIINSTLGWLYGLFTLGQVYESTVDTDLNVYTYRYWLHSKVFDFDGLAMAIGSFNFDETGVDWMESTLICMDTKFSRDVKNLLARDFEYSRLLPKPSKMANGASRDDFSTDGAREKQNHLSLNRFSNRNVFPYRPY